MTYEIAYTQCAGKGKIGTQDALFNGSQVIQVRRQLLPRAVEETAIPLRLAVADGVYASPQAEKASLWWMQAFAASGTASVAFLRRQHPAFCAELAQDYFGSATTLAATELQADGTGRLCNIGDSRVYRINAAGSWTQLSHDHTVLAAMLAGGEASPDIEYSGLYSSLAQCLVADDADSDFECFCVDFSLQAGETLLLCTDGLHDALPQARLESLWQTAPEALTAKLDSLRHAVCVTPFFDDLSIVVARFQSNT